MIQLEPILLHLPLAEGEPLCLVRVSTPEATAYGQATLTEINAFPQTLDFFADSLANMDARDFGLVWERLRALIQEYEPEPPQDHAAVLGAIDAAVWDLAGRELGLPCYRLAGGARAKQVDTYAGGLVAGHEDLVESAKRLRQRFPAVQVTLSGEVDRDLEAIKALRRALGDQAPLLADADGRYEDPETAKRVGLALERAEVFWYEEPLPAGRWEDYAALRPTIGPALAAGKWLYDLWQYQQALQAGALDAVVADLTLCGGLSAGQRLSELARLYGARVGFRAGKWPLAQFVSAHVAAAHWNVGPVQVEPVPDLLKELLDPAPAFKNGFLRLPEGPGLGTMVQESFIERYRVELPEYE